MRTIDRRCRLGSVTMADQCLCTNTHIRSANESSRRSSAPVRPRRVPPAMAATSTDVCQSSRRTRGAQVRQHCRPKAPAEPVAIHAGRGPVRSTDCRARLRCPRQEAMVLRGRWRAFATAAAVSTMLGVSTLSATASGGGAAPRVGCNKIHIVRQRLDSLSVQIGR